MTEDKSPQEWGSAVWAALIVGLAMWIGIAIGFYWKPQPQPHNVFALAEGVKIDDGSCHETTTIRDGKASYNWFFDGENSNFFIGNTNDSFTCQDFKNLFRAKP